jgi:hypothetical protein
MALRIYPLLEDPDQQHELRDDIESFVNFIGCLALQFGRSIYAPPPDLLPRKLRWAFDYYNEMNGSTQGGDPEQLFV